MFYKKDRVLSEVAEKRLSAIKEFRRAGSGIKIAMKDLEIRGGKSARSRTERTYGSSWI